MKTVLIIDDEPDYRKVLGEYLQLHGWQVFEAEEGRKGISLAKKHHPAVVLCDLLMPRCNGFQVCQAIRKDEFLRKTKIIVSSGRDFESDRNAAFEAGADEYLSKPIDPVQLLALLSNVGDKKGKVAKQADPGQAAPSHATAQTAAVTRLKFWGVRGSIPTPGPGTVHYGGNTTCVEVRTGGQIIILDAGTGLRLLGRELISEFDDQPLNMTLLLTHTHWDHIQGLPFFQPAYKRQNHLRILGYEGARQGLDHVLSSQMERPFFPIGMQELSAIVQVEELKEMDFSVGQVKVQACFANHPGICVGYRLFTQQGSIGFFPDNEPHQGQRRAELAPGQLGTKRLAFARDQDKKLIRFLRGTDLLIMDTQYDLEEYQSHIGWGHGCLDDVVKLALQADVKRLYLFHHDPNHDDAKVAEMLAHARRIVAKREGTLQVEAAREGETVELKARS